jgi:hypothetical protein
MRSSDPGGPGNLHTGLVLRSQKILEEIRIASSFFKLAVH